MLSAIKISIESLLAKYYVLNPWTNVYGAARSLLAFSLLITFVFTGSDYLFPSLEAAGSLKQSTFTPAQISLFYLLKDSPAIATGISIGILILVISGYLPQITGVLHWLVAFSYLASGLLIEGGDQISAILTLLLLPICLTDKRLNHWHKPVSCNRHKTKLFVWSIYAIISLQIALIYFHSAIAKLQVTEWLDGTAAYYWFTHAIFGVPEAARTFVAKTLAYYPISFAFTWGTILLELFIASYLFMKRNAWNFRLLFMLALLFHLCIALFAGLISFGISMAAAAILYFYPKSIALNINLGKLNL